MKMERVKRRAVLGLGAAGLAGAALPQVAAGALRSEASAGAAQGAGAAALPGAGASAFRGAGVAPAQTAGAGGLRATANAAPRVRRYVRLGRTGLEVSDIGFGSSRLRNGEGRLVLHALDAGVNYFDTAESYTRGASETVIGKALEGERQRVFIASKTSAGASASRGQLMAALEGSLGRLRTDYVDIYFNHAVNSLGRLQNPEWLEFAALAKRQGKIRFTGMSGHAGRLRECVDYAVAEDLFDVLLVATNFGEDPAFYEQFTRGFDFVANQQALPPALARAKAKDLGVIAMKVLRGARLNDMRPYEDEGHTYAQAAFRWALGSPHVDAAIISMTSRDRIDEYLGASGGGEVGARDMELLRQYARLTDLSYCRHACNDCEGACPYQVPIADVLRTRMYATDYGDLAFARDEYAALGRNASACLGCDGSPCRDACTHGLPIASLCHSAHALLG